VSVKFLINESWP